MVLFGSATQAAMTARISWVRCSISGVSSSISLKHTEHLSCREHTRGAADEHDACPSEHVVARSVAQWFDHQALIVDQQQDEHQDEWQQDAVERLYADEQWDQ